MVRTRFLVLLALVLVAPRALAQGTGRSMDLDVSVRSTALGAASNALFWGTGINHWGNPALLAYSPGMRYEHGHARLVPGLPADVTFDTDVMKVGVPGFGLVFSGAPFPNGVELDYGVSEGTDPSGNPTGTFGTGETVKSWGFGVSPLQMIEAAFGYRSKPVRPSSKLDVSFGMNFKKVEIQLAPDPSGHGSTSAQDWGVLGRITPVELKGGEGPIPLRVDVAYGYSVLSYNDDAVVVFINEDQASPVTRHERQGAAFHMAFDHPGLQQPVDASWSWFIAGLSPLVSLGVTTDRDEMSAGAFGGSFVVSGYGFEADVMNIAAFRIGHYTDRLGNIDDRTWGYAAGLPLGRGAGIRYEQSWFPQASDSGLPHVRRRGFSAWFDPLQMWHHP